MFGESLADLTRFKVPVVSRVRLPFCLKNAAGFVLSGLLTGGYSCNAGVVALKKEEYVFSLKTDVQRRILDEHTRPLDPLLKAMPQRKKFSGVQKRINIRRVRFKPGYMSQ